MITRNGERLLIEGAVTIATVSALLAQYRAQFDPGVTVLDFKGVTEVDSSAVALALECLREASRRKLALSLANLPASMRNLAQLYAVSDLLQGDQV